VIAVAVAVAMLGACLSGALMQRGAHPVEPMEKAQIEEAKQQSNGLLLGVFICAGIVIAIVGGA
jgi:hypothetical protein